MNIMLDLETMGNTPNAAIVAIGAVAFSPEGLGTSFYRVVDLQSSVAQGLQIDASTVYWWLQQSDDARKALQANKCPLVTALRDFADYLMMQESDHRKLRIWGNGATFDNVILSNAYAACSLPRPWPYYGDRCYRTVRAMAPDLDVPKNGTAHNALDDAVYQAHYLLEVVRKLNLPIV